MPLMKRLADWGRAAGSGGAESHCSAASPDVQQIAYRATWVGAPGSGLICGWFFRNAGVPPARSATDTLGFRQGQEGLDYDRVAVGGPGGR